MPPTLPPPSELLLLSDSTKLASVIEMILSPNGHFQTIRMDQLDTGPIGANHWDLMLIAFSQPADKPLDVLHRADLSPWVGCRPMLIIAPHLLPDSPYDLVWCLEFPFDAQALSNRVAEILKEL
jgi:hypothetical protein